MTTLETHESSELSSINEELLDLKKEVDDGRKPKNISNGKLKTVGNVNPEKVGEVSMEYSIAAKKLQNFMSASAPDATGVEDRELERYHFDTVNWGRHAKPHPKMVVKEIKTLNKSIRWEIDSCLQANPARVLELQKKLNKWMYEYKDTSGIIDMEKLNYILGGTGMELEWYVDNSHNQSWKKQRIKEDGKLGPQTYAAISCIKKKYRVDDIVWHGKDTVAR